MVSLTPVGTNVKDHVRQRTACTFVWSRRCKGDSPLNRETSSVGKTVVLAQGLLRPVPTASGLTVSDCERTSIAVRIHDSVHAPRAVGWVAE